jgi:hypothetical protein
LNFNSHDFHKDTRYKIKQYRWDPFEEVKKAVESVMPGGGAGVIPGVTELFMPGLGGPAATFNSIFPSQGIQIGENGNFWDNPFSNLAAELSGQNGSIFNPFALGANLGDPNAIEWRNKWSNMQGWASDAVHSNAENVGGEIAGTNAQRQKEWENKVKQDAEDAQKKAFGEMVGARHQSDLAGSRAAQRNRAPGSRLGKNLDFAANGPDVTDFLGL